jgi:GntR family transcriptional regulator / MocR family aminotransferase
MDPLFELELERTTKGAREASSSLYRQLKAAIADGRLRPGTRLPATRKAVRFFGVSRNTAGEVYERLENEGYVLARHGSGTYVARSPPIATPRASSKGLPDRADPRLNEVWLRPDVAAAIEFWRDRPEALAQPVRSASIDFRPALIDSRLFPLDLFRRIIVKQLRALERKPARYKSPQGNQGNYFLRNAIAKHVALTRSLVCQSEDLLVTSGAQQAFDLLARVVVKPNETVVVIEDPGYPPLRAAFAAAGAKLLPVDVDAEGLVLERLPPEVHVICVSPSHQFPLGVTMSARRRRALIELARKRNAVIIEDDYDGEFRYEGSPLQALRAADGADVVFYVGTFSKCMLPALRLGFIVAPRWALRALTIAKNCLDWHCPTLIQLAVAEFVGAGHLARHVSKLRQVYQKRRQRLLAALQRDFSQWLEPIPSLYGMHVTAVALPAPVPLDLDRIADALLDSHVKIHTLSRYYVGSRPTAGLIFGYGAADVKEIDQGLELLHKVLRAETGRTQGSGPP